MLNRQRDPLKPKDHAEAVAIFRSQVIGPAVCRDLRRGELASVLHTLSKASFTPPDAAVSRSYAVPTLQRWYYAYQNHGLDGLVPKPRSDQGYAQALTKEQRQLLLDIREENRGVSVPVILRTLVADGRLQEAIVSEPTVRRLYADHGLDRQTLRRSEGGQRLRWQADSVGQLWHADVCHGPSLRIGGRTVPLRVHAILDDASRYILAIKAASNEREVQMLELLVQAIRRHGACQTLYLDNGSTYSGHALATACARVDITLLHAKPYDPQARGKMERFWRTLREGCLDHLGHVSSLHDVQVRLLAFLDRHYHVAPHGGLVGKTPAQVFASKGHRFVSEDALKEALTVRQSRRVKTDGTVPVGGIDWEVQHGFLAGRKVTIARTLFDPKAPPWIEEDKKRYALHPVDPKANAKKGRKKSKPKPGIDAVPFDPAGALLDKALSRKTNRKDGDR